MRVGTVISIRTSGVIVETWDFVRTESKSGGVDTKSPIMTVVSIEMSLAYPLEGLWITLGIGRFGTIVRGTETWDDTSDFTT